ncbi:MAG: hypothetical protein ACJA0H_001888 [Francisellaceae bacterium]|jgi:hypothetical protein
MCGAVMYAYDGTMKKVFFSIPTAKLPIRQKNGSVKLYAWGRRKGEAGHLPQTNCAREDSFKIGKWDEHFPRKVKIMISSFREHYTDPDTQKIQYDWDVLNDGAYIVGLKCRDFDGTDRVYVMTINPGGKSKYHRYPLIFNNIE